jgi:hypothetical protein
MHNIRATKDLSEPLLINTYNRITIPSRLMFGISQEVIAHPKTEPSGLKAAMQQSSWSIQHKSPVLITLLLGTVCFPIFFTPSLLPIQLTLTFQGRSYQPTRTQPSCRFYFTQKRHIRVMSKMKWILKQSHGSMRWAPCSFSALRTLMNLKRAVKL